MQHNVLILDFGSQYTQLIARRVRELNIFCEIFPYNHFPSDLSSYKAVILGGSPFSVRGEDAPHPDLSQIRGKLPMLAVCYGAQENTEELIYLILKKTKLSLKAFLKIVKFG
jgi:GMP synthase (glutamine-hydrolysing)